MEQNDILSLTKLKTEIFQTKMKVNKNLFQHFTPGTTGLEIRFLIIRHLTTLKKCFL